MARAANPTIVERRSARRAATWRKAVVICVDAVTPLFTGTAVDISRDGTGIHAFTTLPLGTAVDLEIEPRKDSETGAPIRVSGYVARCESAGPHEYALGIQFRVAAPLRAASSVKPVLRRSGVRPATIPAPHKPKKGTRLTPWLAILTAILLLLLWWPFGDSGVSADHRGGSRHTRKLLAMEPEPVQESHGSGTPAFLQRFDGQDLSDPGPDAELAAADGAGDPADPLDELFGMGGPADYVPFATDMEGGDPGAGVGLEGAPRPARIQNGETISGSYPKTAKVRPASSGGAVRPRNDSSANRVPGDDGAAPAQSQVHLDVNPDSFEMTVFVDGDPVWRFPVGLGRDGSTPSGHFTIHNKIAQPDWYHQGDSVPYGDPRNPLGESWMGLAADSTPLSYGIHPTNEPDSVGDAMGAGCIRMRPEDAETLFRFCPIGATVHIGATR